MDRVPSPRELQVAARACVLLAYAVGLGGVGGGTLLLRDGDWAMAVVLWLVTFAVGTALMGTSLLLRGLSGLGARLARLEQELARLAPPAGGTVNDGDHRDPWLRH